MRQRTHRSAQEETMGLDVNLYVGGTVTDEEFERGKDAFTDRVVAGCEGDDIELVRGWENRVELSTYARYWGPGYERGSWPWIHTWIRALRAAFPGKPIHYGSDSDDDAPEVSDAMLAEYWAHW